MSTAKTSHLSVVPAMPQTSQTAQALQPLTMPLTGLQVIEASAGTGKTWTLAALYVRLVLGHGRLAPQADVEAADVAPFGAAAVGTGLFAALYPPQILVMTFTDAATAELRGRVRERLAQAALFFKGQETADAPADPFLHDLRAQYPIEEWPACAQRLDLSAQWMDDAAIFTIHGWSSRMLKQHAFDSASLFQQSRVEDSDALRLSAVQDYWRQWFYSVPLAQLGALRELGSDPDALFAKLKTVWAQNERKPGEAVPDGKDPHALLQEWEAWQIAFLPLEAAALQACTPELVAILDDVIAAKQIKGYQKNWAWPAKLGEWAQGPALLTLGKTQRSEVNKLLQRFALSTLLEKGWAAATGYAAFGHFDALYQHLQTEPDVGAGLLQHAASHIATAYTQAKSELAQFDFSDLLQCLYFALQAPDGRLASAIRQQYPVALVDEFQDTDPWQYGALSKIYGESPSADTGLLMIGDPKQAIYSFRGADLATYLDARQEAQGIYTLSGNYRSTAQVVAAVNHVFNSAVQTFGAVPFDTVQACNAKVQPLLVHGTVQPALTVWHVGAGAGAPKPPRKEIFQRQMAAAFACQMVHLLNAGAAAPGDMAVLVRSGDEARAMRQALSQRGVRSVYLSERDSVFATQEALDLWRLLSAVAKPRSTQAVRAALATRLWGLPFDLLEALFQDEEAWDHRVEQFHGWQTVWQRQGFLPMLHRLLHDQGIPERLLNATATPDASGGDTGALQNHDGERRLTNLLHLGDLLQTASASLQGEAALIRHLEQQLQHPKASGDTAQLRLESDADLVQVITIHKSKGLQYPLVFLPFVSGFMAEKKDSGRDDAERLSEDIRLLYVAMTRAERALWLGLTPVQEDVQGKTPKVKSAVSQLLQRKVPGDLLECVQRWSDCADIALAAAPAPDATQYHPEVEIKRWKGALQPTRSLHSRWWTASFSALTRDLGHEVMAVPMQASDRDARIDDALIDSATPGSADLSDLTEAGLVAEELPRYNDFPAGSSYGTLLHDLLEWQFERGWPVASFGGADGAVHAATVADGVPGASALGDADDLVAAKSRTLVRSAAQAAGVSGEPASAAKRDWQALLQRKAQRLKLDANHSATLIGWLQGIATAPLQLPGLGFATPLVLADLDRSRAWAEMSFTFPVHALAASHLDALITQNVLPGQARKPLQPLQLEGMLIGFMDLVLEHEGRYFVLDYKSNRLASYAGPHLQAAILEHRYDMQYTLYTLALHRLLKSRLPDYDYAQHMGGALYLFLRGTDQPGGGLFVDRPPQDLIETLDAAFAERSPSSEVLT
ncbi:exodeoxyribonuclease V subunit beta [Rhodoferax lacus]|uniref:RecBCD enzyme subunit RecB n=1 Tax=Rhodoferax lacus TaxID=2184758 RepID=A0A3E1R6Y6_9BURK|nr:UvrD-helicase domain-containing protein [Rhodoferax lacus]RFO95126.1 exodeoxyribonuclease V subunit beta [Rhodoferax lacus]